MVSSLVWVLLTGVHVKVILTTLKILPIYRRAAYRFNSNRKTKSAGKVTVSSISVDPLAFHLGIVLVAALGGYYMTKWFKVFSGNLGYAVAIPEFCTALLANFCFKLAFE